MDKKILENLVLAGIYFLKDKKLLEEVLEYQKQINREIDRIMENKKFACEKGCYYCCTDWDVKGSIPEVILFFREINSLPVEKRKTLKEKLHQKSLFCSFLEDGLCLSYNGRPFICRTYASFDKKICEEQKEFVFPEEVEKALNIVKEKISLLEEPFKTLFDIKIPFKKMAFDPEEDLFFINIGDTVLVYPKKDKIIIKPGMYAEKFMM